MSITRTPIQRYSLIHRLIYPSVHPFLHPDTIHPEVLTGKMCIDNDATIICGQELIPDMYYAETAYMQQQLELCVLTRIKIISILAKAGISPRNCATHGLRWLGSENLHHIGRATDEGGFVEYILDETMTLQATTTFPWVRTSVAAEAEVLLVWAVEKGLLRELTRAITTASPSGQQQYHSIEVLWQWAPDIYCVDQDLGPSSVTHWITRKMVEVGLPQDPLIAAFGLTMAGGFPKAQCDALLAILMSVEPGDNNDDNKNKEHHDHNQSPFPPPTTAQQPTTNNTTNNNKSSRAIPTTIISSPSSISATLGRRPNNVPMANNYNNKKRSEVLEQEIAAMLKHVRLDEPAKPRR